MNARDRRDRCTATDIDVNFVCFQDVIIDRNSSIRLKAGMALDDRAMFESSQPFLYAFVRPSGDFVFPRLHTFHIDADVAIDEKAVFRTSTSGVSSVGTGHERLRWNTSCIH